MKTETCFAIILAISVLNGSSQAAVPSRVICPGNGTDWYNATGSPLHTDGGGIGGADDRNAQDLNRPGDTDNNTPVYAIADGFIERNLSGWSGTSYGQLLLKHLNPDGSVYYSGYLHMRNITSLKATQGAYVRGGTQIGTVSNVAPATNPPKPLDPHLHFAIYESDGTKLRSKTTSLLQTASRPNVAIVGNILINNQVVNQSPFTVPRNRAFTMNVTVRNNGTATAYGNYYLILTRDQNGSQYVGKVDDLAFCSQLGAGQQLQVAFDKPALTSPVGTYFLQVYHDDCSTGGAALKRVSGVNPIAIRLQ